MELTKQQKQAVESNGHNILVSAGAGSGKTRVLTERVFDRISNPKYKWDIDSMLVLTFTNAAAANMKTRIRNMIMINKDHILSDDEKQKQLNKIDSSYIMTFDAFAQFLAKKYHLILNIDKNIKIIDSNIIKNKTNEILNEILINKYDNDKTFINLIDKYCIRDDTNIRDEIINLNYKLNSIYNRNKYIDTYTQEHFSDERLEVYFNEYVEIIKNKIKELNKLLNEFAFYVEDYKDYFVDIELLINAETYDEIRSNIYIDHSKRLSGKDKQASIIKKEIVKLLDEIVGFCTFDKVELLSQVTATKEDVICLFGIAQELNNKLKEYKHKNNSYEFSDVFEMISKLVEDNSEIRNEIKDSFKEILIDEYQDTNDLQDEFIKMISSNNVYMVGDIKQSIYRFRNANPNIFKEKYEIYSNGKDGETIKLLSNYRSRQEVLESVDDIFARTMDSNIGGANYISEHKMEVGNSNYIKGDERYKTEILSYKNDSEAKEKFPYTDLSTNEIEAFIIAKDILDKINSGFEIVCKETKTNEKGEKIEVLNKRKAEFKDFTIIADRGTSFDTIKQILTSCGIPSDIQAEEKIDESDLISVIRAAFNLICCIKEKSYDYKFRYAYTSLARSFVVEMKDSEIYDAITNNNYENTDVYKKIIKITENIESKTISQVLDEIIFEFNIYENLVKIGDVSENFVRIDYIYKLASSLNEMGLDYSSFNTYLETTFEDNEDTIKYKIQKDQQNAVKITNIHQSKGLEYKICYFPLLTVTFNRQDIKEKFIFDKDLGLIIPSLIENKGLKSTILKDIYKQKYLKEDLGERIRLFYVALTRTEEKVIIICPTENKTAKGRIIEDYERLKINCFKDMLDIVYNDIQKYIREIKFDDYKDIMNPQYKLLTKDIFTQIPKTNKKLSVKKEINIIPKEIESTSYSKKAGLIDIDTIKKMKLGTKLHFYLESLDFTNPDFETIESKYVGIVESFLNSEIMKEAKNGKAYKEYEFVYEEDGERKHGFIDLLMEYEDHFDIIDYKTKNIDDEHYDQQLIGYKKYISSISNKQVNCYLYSLFDKNYRTVK